MKLRRIVGVAVEERLKFFGIRLPGCGVRSQREEFIENVFGIIAKNIGV